MQTWRIVHDLGIVSRRPKLALEHAEDYTKKKKIVDNYKKVSAARQKNPKEEGYYTVYAGLYDNLRRIGRESDTIWLKSDATNDR